MAGTSISLQHFHDVQEINVQAVFIVHIDALEFLIFFFFFTRHSLSWSTRKCVLYGFFLSFSELENQNMCIIFGFFSLSFSQLEDQKMVLFVFFSLFLSAGRPEPEAEQRSGGHAD